MITKREAVRLFGGKQIYLADALDIGKAAVSKWPWDEPIPKVHELTIRYELRPEGLDEEESEPGKAA